MGAMPGLKAFVAAVLGCIGSIPGALVRGIAIGLLETFSKAYISTNFSDAIVFGVLVIILLLKPSGLLGKKISLKV
jgi:branched-chain amino acid transport system permease protein